MGEERISLDGLTQRVGDVAEVFSASLEKTYRGILFVDPDSQMPFVRSSDEKGRFLGDYTLQPKDSIKVYNPEDK